MRSLPEHAVYGVALNFRDEWEKLAPSMHRDPYKQPPVAPILYIRPRNTWNAGGSPIRIPRDVTELKIAGTLAIVIGRTACRVPAAEALDYVRGYTVAADASIPHESYYRPAIRQRCSDRFCVIGSRVADRSVLRDPHRTEIRITINGERRCTANTADLVRPVEQLIADITEFLTLRPGDILLAGEPGNAPLVRAGDRVAVEIEGLGSLEHEILPENDVPAAEQESEA
jgi:5-oxopent-3-ene-1,2,5-tricarboxylate decarboxylase / 2-hydroxyhepta-2,4-diene-1,7-dioate isomerase